MSACAAPHVRATHYGLEIPHAAKDDQYGPKITALSSTRLPVVLLMYLTGWFQSTIGVLVAGTNCKACAEREPYVDPQASYGAKPDLFHARRRYRHMGVIAIRATTSNWPG